MIRIPEIVFVSQRPREREAKLAYGLKKFGIDTALLYVQPPNYDLDRYFAKSIRCQNAGEVVAFLPHLRPRITHVFSYSADQVSVSAIDLRAGKTVFDYKDCFENLTARPEHPSIYAAQRRMFENADGICCRDLQAWIYCRVNGVRPRGRRLLFLDYCWAEKPLMPRIPSTSNISAVLVGSIVVERLFPGFESDGFLKIATLLADAGIQVHMYPFWNFPFPRDLSDFEALGRRTGRVHIHEPVAPDRLGGELAQYDFGLISGQGRLFGYDPSGSWLNGMEKHAIAARAFDYLDAGLEIVIAPETDYIRRLFERRGVGIPMDREFIVNPLKILQARQTTGKMERVAAVRQHYAIERHIPKLLRFYASL